MLPRRLRPRRLCARSRVPVSNQAEPLEPRRLLCSMPHAARAPGAVLPEYDPAIHAAPWSVPGPDSNTGGIVWSNRGTTDNIGTVFGSQANAVRNVIDAAFFYWNRVIINLNQQGGVNQLDVTVTANARGSGLGGSGGVLTRLDNKPRTSSITIGGGRDVDQNGTVDDGEGYYIDPNPYDYAEFQGNIVNAFTGDATPGNANGADLFSLVVIELQHALGVDNWNELAWVQDPNDYIRPAGTSHANAANDAVDSPGKLYTFNGGGIRALLTSNNGGTGGTDFGYAIHSARPGNTFITGGMTYTGQDDTGVPIYIESRRYLPSHTAVQMLALVYGYSVNPPHDVIGTFYSVPEPANRRVMVRNPDAISNDRMEVRSAGLGLFVTLDIGNDVPGTNMDGLFVAQFSRLAYDAVIMDGGGGNDTLRVDGNDGALVSVRGNAGNDIIEIGNLQRNLGLITGSVDIQGGSGTDTLIFYDNNFASMRVSNFTSGTFEAGAAMFTYSGVESMTYHGGSGVDSVRVASLSIPLTINGNGGDDILRPGFNEVTGLHMMSQINATITFNGGTGNDSIILRNDHSTNNWFHDFYNGSIVSLGINGSRTIFHSGIERIEGSGGTASDNYFAAADAIYVFLFRGNNGNDTFDLRGGSAATLFGGNGDDTFIFGGGNLGPSIANITAFGEAGFDKMVLDDRNSTHNLPWALYGNTGNPNTANTVFLGINAYGYSGFEAIEVLGGNGNNEFQMHSTTAAVTLNGGGGNDTFKLENFYNIYPSGQFLIITQPVFIDGGSGTDTIIANDQPRNQTNYTLEPARLRANELLTDFDYDITFANINAMTINASNAVSNLTVLGTPATITNQITFFGNGGDDSVTIVPHDAQGNPTFNGTLGYFGGSGSDTLTINATNSPVPLDIRFVNLSGAGTANITGLGAGIFGAANDVEWLIVNGSSGNDLVRIDSFRTGNALRINGGAGDDTVEFGNGNLQPNVTSISSFEYFAGLGQDTFRVNNSSSVGAWTYSQTIPLFGTHQVGISTTGYNLNLTVLDTEMVMMDSGTGGDTFNLNNVPEGSRTVVNAGGGGNLLNVGSAFPLGDLANNIRGPVYYNGGPGRGRLVITDPFNSSGRTVHQDLDTVGAYPGDNLFFSGAFVQFENLGDSGTNPGLLLNLGSGADHVYAQPLPGARVVIQANNPTALPGDRLSLALAGASNYSINPTNATSGNITSSNRQTLSWTGIEQPLTIDDTAPGVVGVGFNVDGIMGPSGRRQAIEADFTENVSARLGPGSLLLQNLTTGQTVPEGHVVVAYDPATDRATFTFPGFADGVLPDGNYAGTIRRVTDFFGNSMTADVQFNFFFLNGDANRDRSVNIGDFAIVASNFNQPGSFSAGDFNYSGTVEISDFAILASKFNLSLPAARTGPMEIRSPFAGERILDQDRSELRELLL